MKNTITVWGIYEKAKKQLTNHKAYLILGQNSIGVEYYVQRVTSKKTKFFDKFLKGGGSAIALSKIVVRISS